LTGGYKGISDAKTTKFLDEGFRQIKEEHKKEILKKGYRRPIITKSKTSYHRYFEFYHPKNPFKKEKEKDKQLSISSPISTTSTILTPEPKISSISTPISTPLSISSVSTPHSTSSTISSPQSFYSPPSSSEILRQTPPHLTHPEITKPIHKTPKKYDKYGTEIRSR